MHVHEHAQGLLIEHLDPLVTRFESEPPLAADDPHRPVYARIGVPVPHYIVSREGALVGVDGARRARRRHRDNPGPGGRAVPARSRQLGPRAAERAAAPRPPRASAGTPRSGSGSTARSQVGDPTGAESRGGESARAVALPPLYAYRFELLGMEPCDEAKPAGAKCARLG
jgi:hypothetical protein